MPMDFYAERVRVLTGSIDSQWTLSSFGGTDPNGTLSEPTGSLTRTNDGRIWINVDGQTAWGLWGGQAQAWTHTANGTEGNTVSATIPTAYSDTGYRVWATNVVGANSPVYRIANKTTTGFQIVSTAPFSNGDKIDILTLSGGFGPAVDGQAFTNLSQSLDTRVQNLSGTIDARFLNLSGTIDGHFNALSGTIDSTIRGRGEGIYSKPTASHAYDDEFESTSLDPNWTFTDATLTASIDPYASFATGGLCYDLNSARPSWLLLQARGDNTRMAMLKSVTMPTNCFVWARFSVNHRLGSSANNDQSIALVMGDNLSSQGGNAIELWANESDANTFQCELFKRTNGVVGSPIASTLNTISDVRMLDGIGIQKMGTTYYAWAFTQAGSATYIGTTTSTMTGSYIGFNLINASTAVPGNMIVGIDFIRFVSSSTYLP